MQYSPQLFPLEAKQVGPHKNIIVSFPEKGESASAVLVCTPIVSDHYHIGVLSKN
jgi:hypothetical protein